MAMCERASSCCAVHWESLWQPSAPARVPVCVPGLHGRAGGAPQAAHGAPGAQRAPAGTELALGAGGAGLSFCFALGAETQREKKQNQLCMQCLCWKW